MSIAPAEAPTNVLNASHRCDRCGSRAYVVHVLRRSSLLPDGGELLFCNHHARKHAAGIAPYIAQTIDESEQLTEHIRDTGHIS